MSYLYHLKWICLSLQYSKGKLAVLGSVHIFSDQYLDKEENSKVQVQYKPSSCLFPDSIHFSFEGKRCLCSVQFFPFSLLLFNPIFLPFVLLQFYLHIQEFHRVNFLLVLHYKVLFCFSYCQQYAKDILII